MDPFITHTGIGVPLRRSDVDTDQIIPAVYLKRITRTGFEDGLFSAWRNDPEFVLNKEPFNRGSILIAGPNFGTGSSREHAVWALQNYGFRVVISASFGDIFRSNSGKSGLLAAVVEPAVVHELWDAVENNPGQELTADLDSKTITLGAANYEFTIDDYTRYRLLNGLDDISSTLQHEVDIEAYEASRPGIKPTTLPVRVAD